MQNQAPVYFHLNDLRSLYRKIVPFLHRLIQAMISTLYRCVGIDLAIPYDDGAADDGDGAARLQAHVSGRQPLCSRSPRGEGEGEG
jgi:hypothetical protein